MNRLNRAMPTIRATSGMTKASARLAIHSSAEGYPLAPKSAGMPAPVTVSAIAPLPPRSCGRANDPVDQIVHALELDRGLREGLASGGDDSTLVALQRSLDDG